MNKLLKILLTIVMVLFLQILNAEIIPSDHIEQNNYNFKIKTFFQMPSLDLEIYYIDEMGNFSKSINYVPNINTIFGIDVSYQGFGLFYKTIIPDTEDATNKYGKTQYNDLKIYFFLQKFGLDIIYQKYKGYYLENSNAFNLNHIEIRNDLEMNNIGFNFYYIFSNDFSMNAAFNQTERQKKWDYTFLVMISSFYFNVNSDHSLIPANQENLYYKYSGYKGGDYKTFSISPGIGLTIPIYNFYFSSILNLGLGGTFSKDRVHEGNIEKFNDNFKVALKSSFGYNNNAFFLGFSFFYDSIGTSGAYNTIKITSHSFLFEFFIGTRFNL